MSAISCDKSIKSFRLKSQMSAASCITDKEDAYNLHTREKELYGLIEKSGQHFYIQLNYLQDMIGEKLDFISRFTFNSQKKGKVVNYFDKLKKTNFYAQATGNLAKSMQTFLRAIDMIVFVNLTQIPEIAEKRFHSSALSKDRYLCQQVKEKGRITFRAIETVYKNRNFQKEETKLDLTADMSQLAQPINTPYLSDDRSAITANATQDIITTMHEPFEGEMHRMQRTLGSAKRVTEQTPPQAIFQNNQLSQR